MLKHARGGVSVVSRNRARLLDVNLRAPNNALMDATLQVELGFTRYIKDIYILFQALILLLLSIADFN